MSPFAALPPLVILAAGRSARMHADKALLDCAGAPWIVRQIEEYERAGGTRVFAIVEPTRVDAIAAVAGAHAVIANDATELGPFRSMQLGLASAGKDAFILPVDVPARASIYRAIAAVPGALATAPTHRGARGHPVWIGAKLAAELIARDAASSRLDHVLRDVSVHEVEVGDPWVRLNLNTRSAWEAFVAQR